VIEVRPLGDDDIPVFSRVQGLAFGEVRDEETLAEHRDVLAGAHMYGAFLDGQPVGTALDFDTRLSLPGGGSLPMAAVTLIGVLPSARRQGALRGMIGAQLTAIREAGTPLAGLWASEATIYGRYGFGVSANVWCAEIDTRHGRFHDAAPAPQPVRIVERQEAVTLLPEIHRRCFAATPGEIERDEAHWRYLLSPRRGDNRIIAVHDDGFVIYSVDRRWEHSTSVSRANVADLVWATPVAHASLWRFLLDLDLVETVTVEDRPLDDPIRFLLADRRRVRPTALTDGLWLRLIDIPAALAARRYPVTDELRLAVRRVEGGEELVAVESAEGGAGAAAFTGQPDLRLTEQALAAIYLGGDRPSTLARAGLIDELLPGALRRADSLFQTERDPWCSVTF
jgi:predicted acetyltransferase